MDSKNDIIIFTEYQINDFKIKIRDAVTHEEIPFFIEETIKKKEYAKEYYLKNLPKIKQYYKVQVECNCGSKLSKARYKYHLKTRLHTRKLKDKKIII